MAGDGALAALGIALLSVLGILVAAKAHGRQVRLLREAAGFMEVDFRRRNAPEVEAIWRRDRRIFWTSFGVLGCVLVPATVAYAWEAGSAGRVGAAVLGLAWAFQGAFLATSTYWAMAGRSRSVPIRGWMAWVGLSLLGVALQLALLAFA